MRSINTTLWCDGGMVREFEIGDSGKAFKWILAEKNNELILFAMPKLENIDFHKELRDRVCILKNWSINELKVLGGGANFDGRILHRSTYFGEMPQEFRQDVLTLLGLNQGGIS